MFDFDLESATDSRSTFANMVCKLLVEKYEKDFYKAIENIEPIYESFFENVRNIYELVDERIPLFALYELKKHGKDNWDFTEEEYQEAINRALNACAEFYA